MRRARRKIARGDRPAPDPHTRIPWHLEEPCEYRRARLGADRHARLRPLVVEAFETVRRRGYRAVHAELARRGVRVSEKVVRRPMREQGLTAARTRPRSCTTTGATTTCVSSSRFEQNGHEILSSFGSSPERRY